MRTVAAVLWVVLVVVLATAAYETSIYHAWRMALCSLSGIALGVVGAISFLEEPRGKNNE